MDDPDWFGITRRNARWVQTTVGWIFWDPGAKKRTEALGLVGPFGYIAARAAPLAPAGPDAVIAAFGSISPVAIRFAFDNVGVAGFEAAWAARDEAVRAGLVALAPEVQAPLARFGLLAWPIIDALPTVGRVLFAAHRRMPRPADAVLSGWHAVNCLREWRGDTHWALVTAAGLTGLEASVLHSAWLGYEADWIPVSRGSSAENIAKAWTSLELKGLADGGKVTDAGLALREQIEDDTDWRTTEPWQRLGMKESLDFAAAFEPPCEKLLAHVDVTAGPLYQPASRIRPPRT